MSFIKSLKSALCHYKISRYPLPFELTRGNTKYAEYNRVTSQIKKKKKFMKYTTTPLILQGYLICQLFSLIQISFFLTNV